MVDSRLWQHDLWPLIWGGHFVTEQIDAIHSEIRSDTYWNESVSQIKTGGDYTLPPHPTLPIRVRNWKLFYLFLNQNRYSKEPYGSFEHQKHMIKLTDESAILR